MASRFPETDADVLMISPYYRPEPIGSGPFCGDLAEAFSTTGRHVNVLTTRPSYPRNAVYESYQDGSQDRQSLNGVDIQRVAIHERSGTSVLSRLLTETSFAMNAARVLWRWNHATPPVVIALCPSVFSVLLATTQRRRRTRCIALVHDIQSGIAKGLGMASGTAVTVLRRLERIAFNRCDLIIVLSEEMRSQLRQLGVHRPIQVHPIWVDTDAITATAPRPGPARTALYSGNLGRKQGLTQLIEAADELARRKSEITVRLRGNGSERPMLEQEIRSRALANVELCDLIPADRISAALAEGDIHLVPQDPAAADYAVPSKIYGIMAAARPFVATANPGSTLWKLQAECRAFLCVSPNDPVALANAVMKLSDNADMRRDLGERARTYVTAHCSKASSLERLVADIDQPRD